MKKNGTWEKCQTCKIDHETPDMACCAWYMDNVVCGDKTTEDCTDYIPCDNEGAEWISVEERLPEQYGLFLIADDKGNMEAATWTKQFGWFSGSNRVNRVTYWMLMPEPPKGD